MNRPYRDTINYQFFVEAQVHGMGKPIPYDNVHVQLTKP